MASRAGCGGFSSPTFATSSQILQQACKSGKNTLNVAYVYPVGLRGVGIRIPVSKMYLASSGSSEAAMYRISKHPLWQPSTLNPKPLSCTPKTWLNRGPKKRKLNPNKRKQANLLRDFHQKQRATVSVFLYSVWFTPTTYMGTSSSLRGAVSGLGWPGAFGFLGFEAGISVELLVASGLIRIQGNLNSQLFPGDAATLMLHGVSSPGRTTPQNPKPITPKPEPPKPSPNKACRKSPSAGQR